MRKITALHPGQLSLFQTLPVIPVGLSPKEVALRLKDQCAGQVVWRLEKWLNGDYTPRGSDPEIYLVRTYHAALKKLPMNTDKLKGFLLRAEPDMPLTVTRSDPHPYISVLNDIKTILKTEIPPGDSTSTQRFVIIECWVKQGDPTVKQPNSHVLLAEVTNDTFRFFNPTDADTLCVGESKTNYADFIQSLALSILRKGSAYQDLSIVTLTRKRI